MNIPTEPTPGLGPTPNKRHGAGRTALVAASGAFVALGMIAGIGVVGAGAQADPDVQPAAETTSENDVEIIEMDGAELDEAELEEIEFEDGDMIAVETFDDEAWAAYDECLEGELGDKGLADDGEAELTDEQWAELEAAFDAADANCQDQLPADVQAEIAAWAPFDECMDAAFGELEGVDTLDSDDELEVMMIDIDDAAFEAIEAECLDLLPADLKAEIEAEQAAWAPFEACIDGIAEPFGEDVVWLDTTDGGVAVAFGEDTGSVTISGTAGDITITESTGVTVLDEAMLDAEFEAMDAEFAACDDLLPEGAEVEMFEEELLD